MNAFETRSWSKIPLIIQALLPLLAPALYAASIYMLLGRIIDSLEADHLSLILVRWMTKILVFGDVFSFAFQCIGGGIRFGASDREGLDRVEDIIFVGLSIQTLLFAAFTVSILHNCLGTAIPRHIARELLTCIELATFTFQKHLPGE
ncbi:hypothetical protein CORC01_03753 [Colletotrichum orchidophilum]|uniref:RTA1 domain-containing protein n=1 Tax=Colletotrichum orchidophilum TaxID=1209926 RepID=A0A1G4BHS9_9PEZI|nr:uncharacterized protein CORC01_03753 [Colletotrichum orchidophilum]OHF00925.1 hypothetical protein CORC01_03753 [Colletotrichum orchidophilum]